ncbi:protein PHLOEM PROTEIN 2-LIKE A9-like isoform X2 [Lycium barbarum]|uniref:protein PHLOEM PROTEIN 2-LIKE A9-like isoform X2 n=1 Tax=Lycium barbarum TaxID=112863 RepID=UPI00293F5DCB|nr:protein PHLOEM PROTEIN 2-LIKE A9-like isoform X2 [Lycium barbarum]
MHAVGSCMKFHIYIYLVVGYIVYPKALNIVWGNDERFWRLPKYENDGAELIQVNWLEVTGCIDNIVEKKSYDIGFTMSLMTDAFGWNDSPVYTGAELPGPEGCQATPLRRKITLYSRLAQARAMQFREKEKKLTKNLKDNETRDICTR